MQLSVREVFELAERCFAAAGFDEGPARANAASFWWTEAYRGTGLTTLHSLLDVLPELDRTALSMEDRSSTVSVIDSDGQPAIVSSTPAVDLSCAQADRHGIGITHATTTRNDESLPMLGHAAYKAAERGCFVVVLATDGAGRSRTVIGRPNDPHPELVERELETPSVSHVDLRNVLTAGVHEREHNPLTQAFFKADRETEYTAAEKRMLNRLLHRSVTPSGTESTRSPGFITVALDSSHPRQADGIERVVDQFLTEQRSTFTRVFHPDEIQGRAETLLHEGVHIDEDVWADIFERSSEVLAPEFEGSYRGAGFNINE